VLACRSMDGMRSTVMRLERQISFENAKALEALRQAYEQLSGAALQLGRDRGYVGSDPLGALGQAFAPDGDQRALAIAAAELWRAFFACFRSDEANFEAQRFSELAQPLDERLAAIAEGGWPDPELAAQLLATLQIFWQERHEAISQRLDALIQDLNRHQQQLGGVQMQSAHQADELQRAMGVLEGALRDLGEPLGDQPGPAQLLGILVGRYRRELTERKLEAERATDAHRGLAKAIVSAARREEVPTLSATDQLAAQAVAQLAIDRHRLMEDIRLLRADHARLNAENRQLMEELSERDRRIGRYEFGSAQDVSEDDRLDLYRKAFAELQAGGNPQPWLAQVRELERVLTVSESDEAQALKIVDRQGAELAKLVVELRGVKPVSEDPKRWRPRMLLGSRYDFKTLSGHAQALRDASRDLTAYAAQARWAQGVSSLAKDVPKLQRVFKEMVSLTAMWREKLGDPPGASMSIRIEQGSSIVALPTLLASDLEAVTRRKGTKANQAASDLVPVLEECIALYRKSLERARGEALPPIEAPKRESDIAKLTRLAQDLTALGGILESSFSEAIANGFTLDAADAALIQSDHLLLLALQQLDVACDVIAVLPGAPTSKFPAIPTGRGSIDKLLAAAKARSTWLEDVARYRFERRESAS
jgi:hypothetical protein